MDVGRELIAAFQTASKATTPGLIGGARELPVRRKLQHLLQEELLSVRVLYVIDSYGGTSKQQDIIIYEQAFCPVFSVNETPETAYYPCEGVIEIGEVKSTVTGRELSDIFEKIRSVKTLRRFAKRSKSLLGGALNRVCFRGYGSTGAIEGTPAEEFNQAEKSFDQIFGFSIAGALGLSETAFCTKLGEELASATDGSLAPNVMVFLTRRGHVPLYHGPKSRQYHVVTAGRDRSLSG